MKTYLKLHHFRQTLITPQKRRGKFPRIARTSSKSSYIRDALLAAYDGEASCNGRNATPAVAKPISKTKPTPTVEASPKRADFEEKPRQEASKVSQEQLDAIDVGDVVFHKAFGYGDVLDISSDFIIADFHEGKKKPSRKFQFPQAFYQGFLQIG